MRKNVGTLDATLRITAGLLGLAYSVGQMARRPYRTPWFLMAMSAMKVAEGITRFCPMLYSMGLSTREMGSMGANQRGLSTADGNSGEQRQIQKIAEDMENVLTAASRTHTQEETGNHRETEKSERYTTQTRRSKELYPTYQE
ncbi:MAG: DUF2892 domain-containing protein [Brevibacillus sp.]|nr:DUF2892 domain-containing protein [Brevibacillus sp.]